MSNDASRKYPFDSIFSLLESTNEYWKSKCPRWWISDYPDLTDEEIASAWLSDAEVEIL